jgi:hypothetical protein
MTDHQCPSCGGFCKKSGCERENVPTQSNGWTEYNALVDHILEGTPYPHIDDWLASRAALTEGMEPVAWIPLDALQQLFPPRIRLLSVPLITYEADGHAAIFTADQLAAAVLAARERCAKICNDIWDLWDGRDALDCAEAIRGQK